MRIIMSITKAIQDIPLKAEMTRYFNIIKEKLSPIIEKYKPKVYRLLEGLDCKLSLVLCIAFILTLLMSANHIINVVVFFCFFIPYTIHNIIFWWISRSTSKT